MSIIAQGRALVPTLTLRLPYVPMKVCPVLSAGEYGDSSQFNAIARPEGHGFGRESGAKPALGPWRTDKNMRVLRERLDKAPDE